MARNIVAAEAYSWGIDETGRAQLYVVGPGDGRTTIEFEPTLETAEALARLVSRILEDHAVRLDKAKSTVLGYIEEVG